jgi:hypothetical protein
MRIAAGSKPSFASARKFELAVNRTLARALGITIPPSLANARGRSDSVIALRIWITVYAGTCYPHLVPANFVS